MEKRKKDGKRKEPASESAQPDGKKAYLTRPSKKKVVVPSDKARKKDDEKNEDAVQWKSASEQADWLTNAFFTVCGNKLSSLEREPIPERGVVQISDERDHSVENLGFHAKRMIPQWKDLLIRPRDTEKVPGREPGSPTLLVLCSSAIRAVELLRGLTVFTKSCKPVKLFAKHIKVDEQVALLKEQVYIGAGTPSRVRKLADLGALDFGQTTIILLDMHRDAKGLSVLSVPEVKDEFWELYRTHLHQRVLKNQLRLCLY
ncbi:protein CMS1 [Marchantia polymorpha subsp. ruderalis]|uniref:Protein CMSS1 n=3 Tax=Marchantia polymorpha TaxID=3197 RepID=A0AAF6AZJ5_MARPO|nr:hypothetical protein MARPO_0037s0098 [Marchantia polymorpha]BBN05179.1 hypothetical protein Mp_3g10980 [Marchantia polymorpha subsp. ruderalis]|eukprot:PTQ40925.1 hypothetical protein MARPO_0037s0098 [Marchantia polymorpha]